MGAILLEEGGVYVHKNEFLVREVVMIAFGGDVVYNDYNLSDGAPFARGQRCSLEAFRRWAARSATPEENGLLRRDLGKARDLAFKEIRTGGDPREDSHSLVAAHGAAAGELRPTWPDR